MTTRPLLAMLLLLVAPASAGLRAEFRGATERDVREDRIPALLVDPGSPPTPFLAPGPFEVEWRGALELRERLRLHFSFAGEGEATLTINGEEVLHESGELGRGKSERIRLNPGSHDLAIRYRSKPDGSARFRLDWEERSFPRQSVPPTAFRDDPPPDSSIRRGRELFAAAHCAKCHLPAQGLGSAPMAEMGEIAPLLADSGARLNEPWIAAWIAHPRSLQPGTRMPALIDATTETGRQQAADLAAWLVTLKLGDPPPAPDPDLAPRGGELFHQLGCVACHDRPDAATPDPLRIPLRNVARKFQPGALADYLQDPARWRPHTGMPDFHLSDTEAGALAAWLRQNAAGSATEPVRFPAGDARRGAELAADLHCGSCHAGLPIDPAGVPSLEAIFAKDWSREGCSSAEAAGALPFYDFSDDEQAALKAFSATGPASLTRHVPAEFASRKLTSLRCTNCHALDHQPARLATRHAETRDLIVAPDTAREERDQSRPQLTYIGEMLHSSYLERVLDGTLTNPTRPWLDMRMPAFHAHAAPLADALARLHGITPGAPEPFSHDPGLAATGERLVGAEGFGCTTCHAVGDAPATAAFEVEGVDFSLARERLRREWYDRWMANPAAVTPGTRMPAYSEHGETSRSDIFDGDAARQFEAIWHFLHRPTDPGR